MNPDPDDDIGPFHNYFHDDAVNHCLGVHPPQRHSGVSWVFRVNCGGVHGPPKKTSHAHQHIYNSYRNVVIV